MYEMFREYGDIDEVIIPKKLNIRGNRYVFVRFYNLEDDRLLAVKLNNIFIGRRKVFSNLPRFQIRGEQVNKVISKFDRVQYESKKKTTKISLPFGNPNNRGPMPYVEVVNTHECS